MRYPKCVVLGGGGFLGSHVCRSLFRIGSTVRSFGRGLPLHKIEGVEYILGDFTDESSVANAIAGFDVVYHLIHATTPATANVEMVGDVQRSVMSTIKLLDACVSLGIKRVIFVSSGGTVYGTNVNIPLKEDQPTSPISAYGANKVTIENYLRVFYQIHGLQYYIARVSNPFGPLQTGSKNQGLIPTVAKSIINGDPINIFGDGSNVRDYIFVDDLIQFFEKLIGYESNERVFNVGGGQGKSILEIVHAVERRLGKPADLKFLPARPFDVPSNVLCIERAKQEVGWSPETDFDHALDLTVDWIKENH
ncbi:NAD-dependent epimerase/dehydratase family protein [Mesorhizobium sp. Cs1299R1N1]|uniref:NAD-dependent epimerase/dehydratase family protein n=1 Tax=Mesorhizobium sp. Cs1299R1N1 TaxID=3015172 RepID=UPI00301BB244